MRVVEVVGCGVSGAAAALEGPGVRGAAVELVGCGVEGEAGASVGSRVRKVVEQLGG